MLSFQRFVLAHDLRDRLDCRKRILHFVRDCGGHLAQLSQTLALRNFSFQLDILIRQPAIFDGDCSLSGQDLEHRAYVLCEGAGVCFNQHHSFDLIVAAKSASDLESLVAQFLLILDRGPGFRALQKPFDPWLLPRFIFRPQDYLHLRERKCARSFRFDEVE